MFGFGLNIKPIFVRGGYVPSDPSAAAYISAAGYQDNDLKEIIDNVFLSIKALNSGATYNKISLMKLRITDSTNNTTALSQMGLNAVAPSSNISTWSSSPTANYSGVSFNGTTQFETLNYNPSLDGKISINSGTIIEYLGTGLISPAFWRFGLRTASISTSHNFGHGGNDSAANTINSAINDAGSAPSPIFTGFSSVQGLNASSRNATNQKVFYRNGNQQRTSVGVVPVGIPNTNLLCGAITLDGTTASNFSAYRSQCLIFGSGMTFSELNSLDMIVNNLQGSLDTLFGLTSTNARKRY